MYNLFARWDDTAKWNYVSSVTTASVAWDIVRAARVRDPVLQFKVSRVPAIARDTRDTTHEDVMQPA